MRLPSPSYYLWASLAALPLAIAAHAEESTLPELQVQARQEQNTDGYNPVIATSATKMAAPLRDIPQHVDVVTGEVIRDQNATSLQDALKNVPGVGFSLGDGQRDQSTLRGFRNISDNYVDGVREDALYYRDLSNVERIEVVKGPASVLFGRGTAGGLINRITKRPQAEARHELGTSLSAEGQRRLTVDLNQPASQAVQLRLTGALEDSESFRDLYFQKREAVAPSVQFRLGEQTRVLVQGEYVDDERVSDQGVPGFRGKPAPLPRDVVFGSATAREDSVNLSLMRSGAVTVEHGAIATSQLRNVFRYYDYELDRNYSTNDTVNQTTGNVSLNKDRRLRDDAGWFNQLEFLHRAQWGGTQHQLLYGVEVSRQTKGEVQYQRKNVATYNLFNLQRQPLGSIPPGTAPRNSNSMDADVIAGYVQDLVTVSPHWKTLIGLRQDRFEQGTTDRLKNTRLRRTDDTVSPRAGVVWQPSDTLALYASWSQSFQPAGETFALSTKNAGLKPEQTINHEVGIKWDSADGRASATVSLFDLRKYDVQGSDPVDSTKGISFGEQRVQGLEASFTGAVTDTLNLIAGYAFLDSEIRDSTDTFTDLQSTVRSYEGKRLALAPRHTANLWLKQRLGERFSVGAGANYMGTRYASNTNLIKLGDYATADVGVYYNQPSWDAALLLKNVADTTYFVSAHSGADNYNMYGAPRTLELNAHWRF